MTPQQLLARQRKILVIDDEPTFTRLLKINLEVTDRYVVAVENDPNRAFAAALDFRPDLLLLDVMMPGLDGGDVVERFRQHEALARIPVVFLTATVTKAEVDARAGRFGGLRFIAKPIDLAALEQCLEEHFAGHPVTAG